LNHIATAICFGSIYGLKDSFDYIVEEEVMTYNIQKLTYNKIQKPPVLINKPA